MLPYDISIRHSLWYLGQKWLTAKPDFQKQICVKQEQNSPKLQTTSSLTQSNDDSRKRICDTKEPYFLK